MPIPKYDFVTLMRFAKDHPELITPKEKQFLEYPPERIRMLRHYLNKPQPTMAAAFKIGRSSWAAWETGRTQPNETNLAKLKALEKYLPAEKQTELKALGVIVHDNADN